MMHGFLALSKLFRRLTGTKAVPCPQHRPQCVALKYRRPQHFSFCLYILSFISLSYLGSFLYLLTCGLLIECRP